MARAQNSTISGPFHPSVFLRFCSCCATGQLGSSLLHATRRTVSTVDDSEAGASVAACWIVCSPYPPVQLLSFDTITSFQVDVVLGPSRSASLPLRIKCTKCWASMSSRATSSASSLPNFPIDIRLGSTCANSVLFHLGALRLVYRLALLSRTHKASINKGRILRLSPLITLRPTGPFSDKCFNVAALKRAYSFFPTSPHMKTVCMSGDHPLQGRESDPQKQCTA
jgi:hypothetical protein